MPHQPDAAELYHQLQKLNVTGKVLYLAAHPDDENTRFISYCANELGFETAYLSLTRGDGGQNLIGTEIREELGILRTQELLAARRVDGGQQFFTRANDFGYSKNPEETLEIWDKDKILSDVVYVIRKFQPDVIVCRFPTDGGGGHGHHTASAMLAKEAFSLAGDSSAYPEQLTGVSAWQPLRVVVNTGRWWNPNISTEDPGVVAIDIGKYSEVLGTSYNELAARSRSNHKSQGFGATGTRGKQLEYFEHLIGEPADSSLFEGVKKTWGDYPSLQQWSGQVEDVLSSYQLMEPAGSVRALLELKKTMGEWNGNNSHLKALIQGKLAWIDKCILDCLGIYMEAKADHYFKSIGDSLVVSFEWLNRSNEKVEISAVHSRQLKYVKLQGLVLLPNQPETPSFKTAVPNLDVSQPYWLRMPSTLGTYQVEDVSQIGNPENPPAVEFDVEIKVNDVVIKTTIPLVYKWNDPVKGELYRPFAVTPPVTANLDQPIYLFSELAEQKIPVVIRSMTDRSVGTIRVEVPKGWLVDYPKEFELDGNGSENEIIVSVRPKRNAQNGELHIYLNGVSAKSLSTIQYDHIPAQVYFPDAATELVFVDLKKTGKHIGYLEGAGDVIPEALRTIGYSVDILQEQDLTPENLTRYDVLITGIRFFNVNHRAGFIVPKLNAFAEAGGTVIVQYNTGHRLKTEELGPYPIQLSRDRVTDENAEPTFINPKHPVMFSPNKLSITDFNGWVQERGLYFPSEWDSAYVPIIRWNDYGEDPKDGSLLIANHGKGHYVYTGISFFRELPAGVPGAYRLLVNLIELEND